MRKIELKQHPNGTATILIDGEPLQVGWNVSGPHLDILVQYHGVDVIEGLIGGLRIELAESRYGLSEDEQKEILRLIRELVA